MRRRPRGPAAARGDTSGAGTRVGGIRRAARRLAWWILVGAAFPAGVPATAGEPFAVVRERVRVVRGDRVVAPVAVLDVGSFPAPGGGLALSEDRNRIRARDPATGAERWSSTLPAGRRLEVLQRSPTTLFARWWKRGPTNDASPAGTHDAATSNLPTGPQRWIADEPGSVRRLSLDDGRWLEPLAVPGGEIRLVHCDERGVVVVSDPGPGTYRLTSFEPGKTSPAWSRTFRSAPRPSDGLSFLANLAALSTGPVETSREVVPAGDVLVVCAGASQELLQLDRASGETLWEIDRLWEFERFHERPNLFGWYVRRATRPEDRLGASRRSRIVAGPFVVAKDGGRRVFVAVTREREEGTGAPVPEGVTYEIDGGEVISVTRLPRPVLDQGSAPVLGGVLWRCEHDALAFQVPSRQEHGGFNGMDSTDRCGALRWCREPSDPPKVGAWLTTSVRAGSLAVGPDATWAAIGGAFVRAPQDKAFRVRLRRMDLGTGAESEFEVVVPFTGDLPSWKTSNHTASGGHDAPTRVEIMHAWGLWTGDLAVRGNRLEIEIVPEGLDPFVAAFPLEDLR